MPGSTLSRRSFLAATAGATAAIATRPPAAWAAGQPILLGQGEHRFECLHDWGRLPTRSPRR